MTFCTVLICSTLSYAAVDIIEPDESAITDVETPEDAAAIDQTVDSITNLLEPNLPTVSEVVEEESTTFENTIKKSTNDDKAIYNQIRSNDFVQSLGVVQKNFLNKTGRIQIFGGATIVPTEVYYRTLGLQLNVGYHFNETYGVNLFGYVFDSIARSEVDDLKTVQSVTVDSLLYIENYSGINFYVNTIYGKMTFFNQKITPFEIFFNFGGGTVNTKTSTGSTGFHAGLGSLYALSPDSGVRFDLNWVFYNAKNINGIEQSANSLMLTLGYSGFVLEGRQR